MKELDRNGISDIEIVVVKDEDALKDAQDAMHALKVILALYRLRK